MSTLVAHTVEAKDPALTTPEEPATSPGHDEELNIQDLSISAREGSDTKSGSSVSLAWGARTDVGLLREHNEDSFLVKPPLFAVCDGMGGHAAGEVASSIAVETISAHMPEHADDVLLGTAVETANAAVIEGAVQGVGKPGMGCTASCALVEKGKMAIAHVGDSRIYLLHQGRLVRLTHDHSYVEELVDAGEITADEARLHPSRSVITRALGSDPDMYADHFTLDVVADDRIIVCSDGLSSMVEDSKIEAISCSTATPQAAADKLTSAALAAGGHDNVTVVVIDILDDGTMEKHAHARKRRLIGIAIAAVAFVTILLASIALVIANSWYLSDNNGTVGIYQGVTGDVFGIPLSHLTETSSVQVSDLPSSTQDSLRRGLALGSEEDARNTLESYRDQINRDKIDSSVIWSRTQLGTEISPDNPATPDGSQKGSGD